MTDEVNPQILRKLDMLTAVLPLFPISRKEISFSLTFPSFEDATGVKCYMRKALDKLSVVFELEENDRLYGSARTSKPAEPHSPLARHLT